MKCPYCARPLRMGVRCRACRRYVFRWPHFFVVAILLTAALMVFLKLIE